MFITTRKSSSFNTEELKLKIIKILFIYIIIDLKGAVSINRLINRVKPDNVV